MNIIDAIKGAADWIFSGTPGQDEPWAQNEEAFEQWFGIPYEGFVAILAEATKEKHDLYTKTMEVNPEAAIIWIIETSS